MDTPAHVTVLPGAEAAARAVDDDRALLYASAFLSGYRGRTREAYETALQQWGAWCAHRGVHVLDVRRAHVQAYAGELVDAGRSPSTVGVKLSALGGFYRYLVDEGQLASSPAARVRRPRVSGDSTRQSLTRAELALLLEAAGADGPQARALVCLLALNGLRVSEACAATRGDVAAERTHEVLTVVRKGGRRDRVPLAPPTAAAIAALERTPRQRLLGLDRFQAARLVERLVDAAGIGKHITPHSLRHTFVTLALDAGVELRDVQDAAGHADPRTTRRSDRDRHSLDRHATYAVAALLEHEGPATA